MSSFTTRDVAELLGLSAARVRSLVRNGIVAADRGPKQTYRFSFQDIVLLRMARDLLAAGMPARKVWRSLRLLKTRLPQGKALSSVRIIVQDDAVVVRENDTSWHPETGQLRLDFSVPELASQVAPLARQMAREAFDARTLNGDEWYDIALDLEALGSIEDARRAYLRALDQEPDHAEAHINLGRLLQQAGNFAAAESHYRKALELVPDDATAAFNLGTVLEDLARTDDAIKAYHRALTLDPAFVDAHYNLGHLYERAGDHSAAVRHLSRYKTLSRHPE